MFRNSSMSFLNNISTDMNLNMKLTWEMSERQSRYISLRLSTLTGVCFWCKTVQRKELWLEKKKRPMFTDTRCSALQMCACCMKAKVVMGTTLIWKSKQVNISQGARHHAHVRWGGRTQWISAREGVMLELCVLANFPGSILFWSFHLFFVIFHSVTLTGRFGEEWQHHCV